MGIGKRQLVLASLVVALGAAVYLNWVFQGDGPLIATDTLTSGAELGAAQLVNGKGSSSTPETSSSASSTSSKAVETAAKVDEYFTEAKLSRQKARDSSVEMLQKVLENASSNDAAKKESVEKAAEIAQNIIQESNIESLIKAKGFSDCVVFLQNSECSVVVRSDGLLPNEAIAIKDIIGGQAGIAYDKIKIVEAK
ncbi:SpoIIIAH-like family protein [Faecalispora anaeroviscerum]|uniref:SpoIIIAH-like family protein n=1 Tax=Faecalispora anaeroviscerum TaxID=2991836 RepID=UPI0024BACDFA|nr:SpoIIIAH-like family protein [Faecalispora anaeroviscerum]